MTRTRAEVARDNLSPTWPRTCCARPENDDVDLSILIWLPCAAQLFAEKGR